MNVNDFDVYIGRMETNSPIDVHSFDSSQFFVTYKRVIDLIKEEKATANENVSELSVRIRNADKDCTVKQQKIEECKTQNDIYACELKTLSSEHNALELEESELRKQKVCLHNRLKSPVTCKISKRDESVFKDLRLKTAVFKNLLGVKFVLTEIDSTIQGYLFNRSNLKWFSYDTSKSSEEEILQEFWNSILDIANTKNWLN